MGTPRYQPYLDVAPDPFRWRLGLRPLDLSAWLEIDERRDIELAEKERIMRVHPDTALVVLDDVERESQEVLDEIVAHLDGLGVRVRPDRSLHPLDAAARLVQEDLVLMVERGGRLICGGGSVCFPNRWDLPSKLGRSMVEIHAPVAGLNQQLAEPIDQFLERLHPGRAYWRLGWGLLDSPLLYQAVDGTAEPRPTRVGPADYHLRVERETLRRLPRTDCVLFTIRTYLTPIDGVPAGTPAATLAAALDALPDDVAIYKELDEVRSALTAWLREAANSR